MAVIVVMVGIVAEIPGIRIRVDAADRRHQLVLRHLQRVLAEDPRALGAGVWQQGRDASVVEPADLVDRPAAAQQQTRQTHHQPRLIRANAEERQ